MIYRKDSDAIAVVNQKDILLKECLMNVTILIAAIVATVIIGDNIIAYLQSGSGAVNYVSLLVAVVMLGCSIRCMVEQYIFIPYAEKKRQDTLECAKSVRPISNKQLVKLLVIEGCPEVKGVEFREKGGVCLRGRYTTHYLEFKQDGAIITSREKDYRADVEANAIMRFLVKASN